MTPYDYGKWTNYAVLLPGAWLDGPWISGHVRPPNTHTRRYTWWVNGQRVDTSYKYITENPEFELESHKKL